RFSWPYGPPKTDSPRNTRKTRKKRQKYKEKNVVDVNDGYYLTSLRLDYFLSFFRVFRVFRGEILLALANHVAQQIHATIRVAPFVVVPANQLEKAIVQLDPRTRIEDARMLIVDEIAGDNLVGGVREDALQVRLAGLFHGGADVFVAGFLDRAHRQIDDGNRRRRHAESHTRQFALDLRDG